MRRRYRSRLVHERGKLAPIERREEAVDRQLRLYVGARGGDDVGEGVADDTGGGVRFHRSPLRLALARALVRLLHQRAERLTSRRVVRRLDGGGHLCASGGCGRGCAAKRARGRHCLLLRASEREQREQRRAGAGPARHPDEVRRVCPASHGRRHVAPARTLAPQGRADVVHLGRR